MIIYLIIFVCVCLSVYTILGLMYDAVRKDDGVREARKHVLWAALLTLGVMVWVLITSALQGVL